MGSAGVCCERAGHGLCWAGLIMIWTDHGCAGHGLATDWVSGDLAVGCVGRGLAWPCVVHGLVWQWSGVCMGCALGCSLGWDGL
jgi:hypothetical protein